MHGEKVFELGMFHPAFIAFMTFFGMGLIVLSVFYSGISMLFYLVFAFAIWVTSLVALSNHRRLKLQSNLAGIKGPEASELGPTIPSVVSHEHLDKVC